MLSHSVTIPPEEGRRREREGSGGTSLSLHEVGNRTHLTLLSLAVSTGAIVLPATAAWGPVTPVLLGGAGTRNLWSLTLVADSFSCSDLARLIDASLRRINTS